MKMSIYGAVGCHLAVISQLDSHSVAGDGQGAVGCHLAVISQPYDDGC